MSEFDETTIDENELNIVTLTDDDGVEIAFEFLDLIEYDGHEYAILLPTEEDEDDGVVTILEVNEVDEDTEEYLSVEDDAILSAVFDIFMTKFQDDFDFADYT